MEHNIQDNRSLYDLTSESYASDLHECVWILQTSHCTSQEANVSQPREQSVCLEDSHLTLASLLFTKQRDEEANFI